jgi:hypothetical protein
MIKILLWIWQLPQHLVAVILIMLNSKQIYSKVKLGDVLLYLMDDGLNKGAGDGISLGQYILLDRTQYVGNTVKHEMGHSKQSIMLGPLYLLAVGVPSILRANYSYNNRKSNSWYYSGYPEKWADKLGNVNRLTEL